MQAALLFEGAKIDGWKFAIYIELDEENAGWLLAAPGMSALVAISNDLRSSLVRQSVGKRFVVHREFADLRTEQWQPYKNMERGIIPEDAVMVAGAIGILPYYIPDLTVVDNKGLADATIARNPVTKPNRERRMAHDRQPPHDYLEKRGVNIKIHPAVATAKQALGRADYAVPVGPDLWMPFDSSYLEWSVASFASHGLISHGLIEVFLDMERTMKRSQPPALRSDYEVYVINNNIIYRKEPCREPDTTHRFFLHVIPLDVSTLPDHRKEYGYDNRDFNFKDHGHIDSGATCFAARELPDYNIASIRTGQYIPDQGRIWEGEFHVARE